MNIKIHASRPLAEIKEEFSMMFPYLKLEFFRLPHRDLEPTSKKAMIKGSPVVGEVRELDYDGELEITSGMKVDELENSFRDDFGLNVQVFRKSGHVWLETSSTDKMTLEEQNMLGLEKVTPPAAPDLSDIDYD